MTNRPNKKCKIKKKIPNISNEEYKIKKKKSENGFISFHRIAKVYYSHLLPYQQTKYNQAKIRYGSYKKGMLPYTQLNLTSSDENHETQTSDDSSQTSDDSSQTSDDSLSSEEFLAGFLNMQESIKMKTDNIFIHELQRYSLIIINHTVPS
ncbi:hypothetical protein RhiirA4_522581 [Rhizophagus irregularis]|uniref:Uncharacterized protein n=1 Tax=Rhizophagus irregularis TaxID=588596 RepID=A0A2I1GLE1_9GLOM|nr:hypothetical protein RhiirA4_519873 [Rhizophagus irregularis]PKY47443.1 hypothetical protein RhiirA4_522581 [Rhizophagus irregularis]